MTNTPAPSIRAVAFDLDGTLVNSSRDIACSLNAMLQAMSRPSLPLETIESYIGDGIVKLIHRALTNDVNGVAPEDQLNTGLQHFATYYRNHLAIHTKPYPYVIDTLALLKARQLPLAIVTNKHESLAVSLLQKLNLSHYFSIIIGADTLPEKKPSALPLQHAAEVMGVACHEMLMVGDSANDVLAAQAAGCPSFLLMQGYAHRPLPEADFCADNLSTLYDVIFPNHSTV